MSRPLRVYFVPEGEKNKLVNGIRMQKAMGNNCIKGSAVIHHGKYKLKKTQH